MVVTLRHLVAVLVFIGVTTAAPEKRAGKTLLCYYGSWGSYRQNDGELQPPQIDNSCTHLVYAFAGLDDRTFRIKSLDAWNDLGFDEVGGGKDNYRHFAALKNRGIKILLAIGGWNEGSTKYSAMVSTPDRRQNFISSVVSFLDRYGFDGLDFDWEWPGERGGMANDKANLVLLLKELNAAFKSRGYMLTAAAPALPASAERGYNLIEIMKYVDYLSLMTYDYYTNYNRLVHATPLRGTPTFPLSVEQTIDYYITHGGIPEKLLLGVSLYGRTFRMSSPNLHQIGDSASGPANQGPHSQTQGLLAWFELCRFVRDNGFTVVRDATYGVPYAYNGNEWYAYEDQQSLREKVQFAQTKNLGGIMVWSLENDDNHYVCGNTLTSSIRSALG